MSSQGTLGAGSSMVPDSLGVRSKKLSNHFVSQGTFPIVGRFILLAFVLSEYPIPLGLPFEGVWIRIYGVGLRNLFRFQFGGEESE